MSFFISVLLLFLLIGCKPDLSGQIYKNLETGIGLNNNNNWNVHFNNRNGMIILEAKTGILLKEYARIEIIGGACPTSVQTPSETSFDLLQQETKRIARLYNLESVNIEQEPIEVESKDYEIFETVIAIPTTSMVDDPNRIQVGKPEPGKLQTVDILVIRDGNNVIMTYIYKGNSEKLNKQAREIVESIRRTCADTGNNQPFPIPANLN